MPSKYVLPSGVVLAEIFLRSATAVEISDLKRHASEIFLLDDERKIERLRKVLSGAMKALDTACPTPVFSRMFDKDPSRAACLSGFLAKRRAGIRSLLGLIAETPGLLGGRDGPFWCDVRSMLDTHFRSDEQELPSLREALK
jgi:hypothetical protein